MKRKQEELAKWEKLFNEVAVDFMDDMYTEISQLKLHIDKKMPEISKPIRQRLYEIMVYEGSKVITKKNYN